MLRSWYEQGMIDDSSPILGPGVPRWTPLARAVDVSDWTPPPGARRGGLHEEAEAPGPQRWRG